MNLVAAAIDFVEKAPLPDAVTSAGIDWLVGRARRRLGATGAIAEERFVTSMSDYPIAIHAEAANSQHYELPPQLFQNMLGPRLKYSCCLFHTPADDLATAEVAALQETCAHADLADGQSILEWGCGWGSLTLTMAEAYPRARILAVSNSAPQQRYIQAEAARRELDNVEVVCADMNEFRSSETFDRIVSVEMFEHMSNWRDLLDHARGLLRPDGRLFLHVFTHRSRSYRFDHNDPSDWIARHFFTGGIMPAFDLPRRFGDLFAVEQSWRWSGLHYQRTALAWLANFDARRAEVDSVLEATYGRDAALWRRRWRLFLLSTAGLFGHAGGEEWAVGHYRLAPVAA